MVFRPVGSIIAPRDPVSQVRRPHAEERSHSRKDSITGEPCQEKTWKDSVPLQKRTHQLRRSMKVVRPWLENKDAGGLQVVGVPLLQWVSSSSAQYFAQELERAQEEEQQTPEATRRKEGAARRGAGASRAEAQAALRAATQGPQLRMRIGPDATEDTSLADTLPGEDGSAPRRAARLAICGTAGARNTSTVTLRNPGDCALHLTWSRLDKEWGDIGATGGSVAGVEQGFLCQPLRAVLLPGESVTTTFTHQHNHEGIYSEQWKVSSVPPTAPLPVLQLTATAPGRQEGAVPRMRASKSKRLTRCVRPSRSLLSSVRPMRQTCRGQHRRADALRTSTATSSRRETLPMGCSTPSRRTELAALQSVSWPCKPLTTPPPVGRDGGIVAPCA